MKPCYLRAVCLATAAVLIAATALPCLGGVPALAQAAAATSAAPKALFIEILQGEGEMNDIRARTAREPIVQIRDENHRPVAGALVLFTIDSGGGGAKRVSFGKSQTVSVRTDSNGQAIAQGFHVMKQTGQVRVLVQATLGAAAAEAVITQTNFSSAGKFHRSLSNHKVLVSSAVVAVATAISLAVVESGGGAGATITPGTGVVRGIVIAGR